jgi:hypothetical protein
VTLGGDFAGSPPSSEKNRARWRPIPCLATDPVDPIMPFDLPYLTPIFRRRKKISSQTIPSDETLESSIPGSGTTR